MDIDSYLEEKLKELEEELNEKEKILKNYKENPTEENVLNVSKVNIDEIKKKIEILKDSILKRAKRKLKSLSEEEINEWISKKISDLEKRVVEVQEEKEDILIEIEQLKNERIIHNVEAEFDGAIKKVDFITDTVADFWTMANDEENQKAGILVFYLTVSRWVRRLSSSKRSVPCTLLEYQLSKKYGVPYSQKELNSFSMKRRSGDIHYTVTRIDSEFYSDTEEISLIDRDKINKKNEKIKKMQEKLEKNPEKYSKHGTITLFAPKSYGAETFEEVEIEITEGKLISLGLDPKAMRWKKKEQARVDSKDIAMVAKKRKVKKSLVERIQSIFSKDRDKDDESRS